MEENNYFSQVEIKGIVAAFLNEVNNIIGPTPTSLCLYSQVKVSHSGRGKTEVRITVQQHENTGIPDVVIVPFDACCLCFYRDELERGNEDSYAATVRVFTGDVESSRVLVIALQDPARVTELLKRVRYYIANIMSISDAFDLVNGKEK